MNGVPIRQSSERTTNMSYRYKVLRVNLTTSKISTEPLNNDWAEKYWGGRGLGAKYLYEELKQGVDAFSPKNKIILATGPFTGTVVPCSGKLAIISKSPATGTIVDSSIGGKFASQLKFAGFDLLIVEGQAEKPVYLDIQDDRVEIRAAENLWGKGIYETEATLLKQFGHDNAVLSIGPAGENRVPFSCIGSECRQAGRGGIGAVMGSKRLKAIVCSGSQDITVPDMPRLLDLTQKLIREDVLTAANLWAVNEGTPTIVEMANSAGILPTRNFQDGVYPNYRDINAASLAKLGPGKKACSSCALGCGKYLPVQTTFVEGPEYETLAISGSNCGIGDLQAIMQFNAECDDLGLDTISMGSVLALAMELTEKRIKDFGVRFGDIASYLRIPKLVAYREGVGKELSLGARKLADKYEAQGIAMQVKGLELPGYDPRGSWAQGLAYATANRGGCHMSAWPVAVEAFGNLNPFTMDGKAQLVISLQNANAIKFSLILCDFWAISPENMSKVLSCVMGREVTPTELDTAGERIWNLFRMFNVREGFRAVEDTLPARFFNEILKSGNPAGKCLPRDQFLTLLGEYYRLRGWDEDGVPRPEKLDTLRI